MTNDAPRTIWADQPQVFDDCDVWHSEPAEGRTEYIRADIAQAEQDAAVAAEREACARRAVAAGIRTYEANKEWHPSHAAEAFDFGEEIAEDIRARGNTDVNDALAEHDARVRAEALREAANFAAVAAHKRGGMVCSCSEGLCEWIEQAILALITDTEKGGK
jgi:hypothetical protein